MTTIRNRNRNRVAADVVPSHPRRQDNTPLLGPLEDRVAAEEAATTDHETRITQAESDINDLQAADVALDGRLDALEALAIVEDGRLDALEAAAFSDDARLDALEALAAVEDGRLDALEAYDAGAETRLDALEAADTAIDGRLDALEAIGTKNSVEVDASDLQLVGDEASPGNDMVYGTDGSGNKGWKADPAGGGAAGANVAIAYHNAVQSIADSTWTTLSLNSEDYDSGTVHDLVTNNSRLTIPANGRYLLGGVTRFAASATGARGLRILKNGAGSGIQFTFVNNVGASLPVLPPILAPVDAVAGDYFQLQAYQESGGALDVGDASRNQATVFYLIRLN